MRLSDGIVPDDAFRERVHVLCGRFGSVRIEIAPGWEKFADQLEVGRFTVAAPPVPPAAELADQAAAAALPDQAASAVPARAVVPVVLIGPPAFVLACAATTDEPFGFVTPDARMARPWQQATTWRDDTTLRLWDRGWSIMTIDRLVVPTHSASLEFVIASVRRTPETADTG